MIILIFGLTIYCVLCIFIIIVLILAARISCTTYTGMVELEETNLWAYPSIDLKFVEELSAKLQQTGFKYLGDYEVTGLKENHYNKADLVNPSRVAARYFIDHLGSTVGVIYYLKIPRDRHNTAYQIEVAATGLYFETSFKQGAVCVTSLLENACNDSRAIMRRLFADETLEKCFFSIQDFDEALQFHQQSCLEKSQNQGLESYIMDMSLLDILNRRNQYAYQLDTKHYKYNYTKQAYQITYAYSIELVLNTLIKV